MTVDNLNEKDVNLAALEFLRSQLLEEFSKKRKLRKMIQKCRESIDLYKEKLAFNNLAILTLKQQREKLVKGTFK